MGNPVTSGAHGFPKPKYGTNEFEGANGLGDVLEALDAAMTALAGSPAGRFIVSAPAADQTITGGKKLINTGGFQGPVTGDVTGNVTGNSAGVHTGGVVGDVKETVPAATTTSGAITAKQGVVRLGSAGSLTMPIADPTSGTDDGKILKVIASTAHAHVITVTGGLAGGTNNTLTLGGAIGDLAILEALGGKWFLLPSINAAASHV